MRHHRIGKEGILFSVNLVLAIGLALSMMGISHLAYAEAVTGGPSAFCHVTDGTFTICPDGNSEWSDIPPTLFPESGGVLLVDQADLDPTRTIPNLPVDHLMLMYEAGRLTPLGPDEYVFVHFMTVEEEKLLHYAVRVYGDATIQVFIDGVDRGPRRKPVIDTMKGAAGFGPSPSNPTPHVLAEFQIGLELAGFVVCCYSPDPAWWSSAVPRRKNVVALFTGFSGSSGNAIGMEQLRGDLAKLVDVVAAAERYGHSQQKKAVEFLRSQADVADIVLIGHSFGADSAIEVAHRLNDLGISVEALIQIDSVGFGDDALPGNVQTGLNFFDTGALSTILGVEQVVEGSTNVDAESHFGRDIVHTEIDNDGFDTDVFGVQDAIVDFKRDGTLPSGEGVTPPGSPTRNVTILGPLFVEGLVKLISNTLWDSGLIPLESPVTLSGKDGVILDVVFIDKALLEMGDSTGVSPEKLTVELFGTVIAPEISGGLSDTVEMEFQFDDFAEELQSSQVFELVSVSSDTGRGLFEESVNLTDAEFNFGGFTLELLQNGTGVVQISGFRIVLEGDNITQAPGPPPPSVGVTNGGFETCTLAHWDVAPLSVATARTSVGPSGNFTPILPSEGQCMALLSTAGLAPTPPGTKGSVISQTFVIPETAKELSFSYQFVSNDSGIFENFFLARLETTMGTFILGAADNAAGSPAGGSLAPPPPVISAGVTLTPDVAPKFLSGVNILGTPLFIIPSSIMTNRVVSTFNIPPELKGTTVTLRFIVGDAIDTAFDSAVVIDDAVLRSIVKSDDTDSDGILNAEDNCPIIPNPDQVDANLDAIGDACEDITPLVTTGFLQANKDGSSTSEPTELTAGEPPLEEQLARIVTFRVEDQNLSVQEAIQLINNLVNSQVELGVVPPGEVEDLINTVIEAALLIEVSIDIKPGSFPNSIKLADTGAIPVAILSTGTFDATTIDPSTITLNSASARSRGKGVAASVEDVNQDGLLDLVVQIDRGVFIDTGNGTATLNGLTFEGVPVRGTDSVRVIQ